MALKYSGSGTKFYKAPIPFLAPPNLPSGAVTIIAWFRLASGFTGNQLIAGFGNGTSEYIGTSIYTGSLVSQWRTTTGGAGTKIIATSPADLGWHMVAYESVGTNMFGGIDGATESVTAAGSGEAASTIFMTGGGGGVPFLNGTSSAMHVAEISTWNGRLGASEVQALYLGASPLRLGAAPSMLMRYYPLRNNLLDYGPERVGLAPSTTAMIPVWTDHPPTETIPERRPYLLKASGGAGPTPLSATLVSTLADAIMMASGTVGIASALSGTLDTGALSATATSAIGGVLNDPLAGSALSGTALSLISAKVATALDAAMLAAAGTSSLGALLVEALADLDFSGAAAPAALARLSGDLDVVNLAGRAASSVAGGLSGPLDPLVLSAIAAVISGADATLFETLDPLVLTAAGTVALSASLIGQAGGATLTGRGAVGATSTFSQAMSDSILAGRGGVGIAAALSTNLADSILSGLAFVAAHGTLTASLSQALQDALLVASGAVSGSGRLISTDVLLSLSGRAAADVTARLMATLDPATLIALASVGSVIRLSRPHAGRLLIVPADRRILIVPADNRFLSATDD